MTYRVAVLGTSQNVGSRAGNVPRAYRHAMGYDRLQSCELTCCADPDRIEAEAFAETFGIDAVYTEYEPLLENEDVDIVSICTPPATHARVVFSCLSYGTIEAIHCETPVATRWVDCKAMVRECEARGIQLTFSFPRRFSRPVSEAKRLVESGAIGELRRLEWSASNLFTDGTHHFDLCDRLTGGRLPLWTLAGVDTDPDNRWDGTLNEILGLAKWEYDDGVQGLASTAEGKRETTVNAYMGIVGHDGVIEIEPDEGPPLRIRTDSGWRTIDTGGETIYGRHPRWYAETLDGIADRIPVLGRRRQRSQYDRVVEHVVSSLENGVEPVIAGRHALRSTELTFACWESARRRGRIDLPLGDVANPLEALCQELYGPAGDGSDTDTSQQQDTRSSPLVQPETTRM